MEQFHRRVTPVCLSRLTTLLVGALAASVPTAVVARTPMNHFRQLVIPPESYTVLRLISDDPGLSICHIGRHPAGTPTIHTCLSRQMTNRIVQLER